MSYGLGVDLGTTFTAAAVARDGRVEMATLGDHTDAVPSVVLVRDDGTVLTGGAAERRAATEPDRVARAVKRRFGDPMPVILGGAPYPATALIAYQLRDVVDVVSRREGGRPDMVTLTHPANWGPYKRELFAQVPGLAGLGEVQMLTEPEAAAAHYARNDRLEPGALIAVYDLGGGTFDATVLRTTEQGFDILGRPEGIEGLGGVDFDEAVFAHVDQNLDGAISRLDPADPRATSAVIRLRHECVTAKEALSADTETAIPVLLPDLQTEVRLTRGEFERMIRPAIGATIGSLRRALQSAEIDPDQLHTVLLVGGSSRIPMVGHLVSAELGCPTSVDTHPKHAVALGAAAVGADQTGVGAAATASAVAPIPPVEPDGPAPSPAGPAAIAGAAAAVPPLAAGAAPPPLKAPPGRRSRRGHNAGHPGAGHPGASNLAAASNLAPEGDRHPEPDPSEPSGDQLAAHQSPADQSPADQPPDRPRRRRAPAMIGLLVLVAALAGGGTAAYRVLSNSTPTTNNTLPVSHTSSSASGTPTSTHTAARRPANTTGHGTPQVIAPTVAPATTPYTPRTSQPAKILHTYSSPTKTWKTTTPPVTTWTTSPPPTSPPPVTTWTTSPPASSPDVTTSTGGATP